MATTRKVLSSVGVPAMCAQIASVKRSANLLSDALNQAVGEIEGALNDFPVSTSISISTSGWQANTDTQVTATSYFYDINNVDIDQYDLPIITVAPTSLEAAIVCGLCSTCESLNGKIRLYAKTNPSVNLTVSYFIIKGKQPDEPLEYDLSYND